MSEPQHFPLLDLELLDRYLVGEVSPQEREHVERWLAVDPVRTQRLQNLQRAGGRYDIAAAETLDVGRAWNRVFQARKVAMHARHAIHDMHGTTRRSLSTGAVRYLGMALVIGIVVTGLGWLVGTRSFGQQTTAKSVYTTANGQRATITLPDGSTVALNAASRLEVPGDYAAGNLHVRLVGEALFTVTHHGKIPFTVNSGETNVRVLGTSFLVRHYSTDSTTRIAVREGKVMVRSAILTASQQMEVLRTGVTRFSTADPAQFSFVRGVLTLDGVRFPEAIAALDRWYDVDIRLGDPSLVKRRVAGECAAGSIADLANVLALTFDVRVVRDGRVLTLFPR